MATKALEKIGRHRCEFRLLRYVPDAVRNECVHIGVMLYEEGSEEPVRVQFTRDWRRVKCLDPDVDVGLLEGIEEDLRKRLRQDADGRLMKILDEALSLNIQISESKAYLAESLPTGLEELMRIYVDPPARIHLPKAAGRTAIQTRMRREFEAAGVWDLMRKRIAASQYTRAGDPLRIDVGYRPNGVIRMFHGVSLEPGADTAKVLAFSQAKLREGVLKVEKAELELTAIVEPAVRVGATEEDPERLEMYRFGVETMEEHGIRVLTTEALGRIAEKAKWELIERDAH